MNPEDHIDTNNPEFQKAYNLVEKTNQSFFLTGKAGTGKSTFLNYIKENVNKDKAFSCCNFHTNPSEIYG